MSPKAKEEMVNLTINNMPLSVPKGTRVIEAAKYVNIDIPHLCYHPDQKVKAHCRMCAVEVEGSRKLLAACSTLVWEGMVIHTDTKKVRDTQVGILELILADHQQDCLNCARNKNCELQSLCDRFNLLNPSLTRVSKPPEVQMNNPSIVRNPSKCIKCGRCVNVCEQVQGISALTYSNRSDDFRVTTAFNTPLDSTACVLCGQCSVVCPTAAIVERDNTHDVFNVLHDPNKHVIVQVAPSVRVALGDEFGLPPGSLVTGKMVSALKIIGFDKVFDTNFSADLTIMEEGAELIDRLTNKGTLPMLTSCSPGWVNYMEKHHPGIRPHVSTAKSPQQMFGAISKTYYAEKVGIDPKNIVTVSVMPCTAKKFEAQRPEMGRDGYRDVDIVLTTRELTKMIKYVGLDFENLNSSDFDSPLGIGSGAGAIFGASGGVMEAALRTVYETVTKKELDKLEFEDVRGFRGIKEATVDLDGLEVKVAIAHGLTNAEALVSEVEAGNSPYTFIEIMGCPGGCIGGGGQPVATTNNIRKIRIDALYSLDKSLPIRKSHENPEIITLYDKYLGKPLGHKAHELLHTSYIDRSSFI